MFYIIELKNKNWNWKAISQRKKIDFTNETFLQLLDKDWDWEYLSNDTNIEFNARKNFQIRRKQCIS